MLDHDAAYTISVMQDFMNEITAVYTGIERVTLWSDVGPHFRASRFMAWWLCRLPASMGMQFTFNMHPPGHGKGDVDGFFGRLRRGKDEAAQESELWTKREYCLQLQRVFDSQKERNPASAEIRMIDYEPAPKDVIPAFFFNTTELADAGMGVKSCFLMWASPTACSKAMTSLMDSA